MTQEKLRELLEGLSIEQRQTVGRTILLKYNQLNPTATYISVEQVLSE